MIGCFFVLAAMLGGEQKNDYIPSALRGLACVKVRVGPLSSDAKDVGLTPELLQTTVELRLRSAGVAIGDPGKWCKNNTPAGILVVDVNVQRMDLDELVHVPLVHYAFQPLLWELAKLDRNKNAGPTVMAGTWKPQGTMLGYCPRGEAKENIQSGLRDMADSFANAYLKANPKGEQKKGDGK